tara:strand:+ start:129 stop:446 length:318 start_codon:yes stop_codon:yes gene_type:complete
MAWGLKAPEGVSVAWDARAIYKAGHVDLLHDRQSWTGDKRTRARKALLAWLNGVGLRKIKETVKEAYLPSDSAETVAYREGGFVIKASPRQSYGYLYLVAYKEEG